MRKTGLRAVAWIALMSVGFGAGCTGESSATTVDVDAIAFETTTIPPAGAGELYDVVIRFTTVGKAAPPDRFELLSGELPEGVSLVADREDIDGDGIPDPDGALTGNARLVGYPRIARPTLPYNFVLKAISTGVLSGASRDPNAAALAAEQPYQITVGEGRIAILNPTAAQGTTDPAVPAFPDVINFVNPANPQAFFSFAFQTAGGSGNNNLQIYMPRELELSVFDALSTGIGDDTNEAPGSGSKYRVDFSDGGVFNLQAGTNKVQIGGFQSPRGIVGVITNLDSDWFQNTPGAGGPPLNSRRDFLDSDGLAGGDDTLGAQQPILFSDYFSPAFLPTWGEDSDPAVRRKYPFIATEYQNAFFLPFDAAVHQTPLRYNVIVEAIDNRGTVSRDDDIIARRSYAVQVRIPDIVFDTVVLADGRAGVDYMEFINGSGGVPPLEYDLEWVDGIDDAKVTSPAALDKAAFGINIDSSTGGFYGVPKAAGDVDLSVRIFAAVMNPSQSGSAQVPTGGTDTQGRPNEWNGTHAVTGKPGIHKTIKVFFATPSQPVLANAGLPPGIDGNAYLASGGGTVKLTGSGGVPTLIPDPVTFSGVYPANPTRSYAWSSLYVKDKSHPDEGATVPGLPNALTLDGDPFSTTNGQITGTAFDRGFHPVTIQQIDFYIGPATVPDLAANRQTRNTTLTLSISPDNALYMRGLQTNEGSGGNASGLLGATQQIAESRMVPMFLESALFLTNTGEAPQFYDSMPAKVDILPVAILNGGSQANTERDQPTVGGFWPAEANKENDWYYYGNRAWKDTQQEMNWIQIPNQQQTRVFLWAETSVRSYNSSNPTSSGSNNYTQRFQVYDASGDRGILVVNPGTGEFWMPARLDNNSSSHGFQFGAEYTRAQQSLSYYEGMSYGGFYYYSSVPYNHVWAHTTGLGVYLESHGTGTTSSNGWQANSIGRTATSVAVSADGLWCATAMPGGDAQKFLLFRTDGQSIDPAITGQGYITGVDGADADGNAISNSAAIVNVGGSSSNDGDFLNDSLMFVDGGIVFLRYTNTTTSDYSLDRIFGLNLVDGTLSETDIDNASALTSTDQSPGKMNWSSRLYRYGIYIPDQDVGYGNCAQTSTGAQFAFTGNEAADGATGPNALAFVAGDNKNLFRSSNSGTIDREGFQVRGNARKSLFFLEINSDASTNGLDLSSSTITDLTGSDSRIQGDFLTPGRRGESRDYVKMSSDGKYIAAVRDLDLANNSSYYGTDTFGSGYYYFYTYNTSTFGRSSDDLLLVSTPIAHAAGETDLDSNKNGDQHVLFIGTNSTSTSGSAGSTPSMPNYASARNLINGNTKRISGLEFSQDNSTLLFDYSGDSWTMSKHSGYLYGWGFNAGSIGSSTTYYNNIGIQMGIRFHFRDQSDGGPIDITDSNAKNLVKNVMEGMSGVGLVGDTTPPFTATRSTTFSSGGGRAAEQLFQAKIRSANGDFLYIVSDRIGGNAHMIGINMTGSDITSPEGSVRKPYEAFKAHGSGVSFEQFEYRGFLYANRIASSPSGTTLDTTGRDGSGIVFIIGSDSASPGSATNLEIYAFNANEGGELVALTSAVTTGSSNAINYMYPSMDGNTIVAQRSNGTTSRDSRTQLTTQNDIIAVNNVHDVLFNGASPSAFTVSSNASHGSTVAFVGDGTPAGAVALVYSHATGTGNTTWDERNLYIGLLAPGAGRSALDTVESHYTILSGGRKLDDDPTNAD